MSVNSEMTALANAVRSKSGRSGKLTISGMTAAVNSIDTSGGGGSAQPSVEQATPTISVNSNGLVTASVTQQAGNVSGGTKTKTHQLSAADDSDLTAANIVAGKTIFGVQGSHSCSAGAPTLQTKTVDPKTSAQTVTPDSGYDGLSAVTVNAMPTATQAMPSISVNSSTGVITASATQSAGYVPAGTKSATQNLTTQAAKTVTPTASEQTAVAAGRYTTGAVKVAGDSNLKAANIKKGVSIFGVSGSFEGAAVGGGSVYPDGAFAPVTEFTDGKQYALVSIIGGVRRFINTTDYNQYTMNATQVTIAEDAGDYVIFSATPALFTAVASGGGFLLQNGTNYLHGSTSNGTALRVGTTQAVWTVDDSETGGFSSGKYNAKEDGNAVWLKCNDGTYDWSIKYETGGGFGYDREGRDNQWSTGFTPFVLYEYVAGEGEVNPICDTSDATAKANDILDFKTAYVQGEKVTGNIPFWHDEPLSFGEAEQIDQYQNVSGELAVSFSRPARERVAVDEGNDVSIFVKASEFGNATAADVASGKTFTSANGVKITGTASASGGGSGGSTVKTGTTTSGTINTGLSSIDQFFLYKESVSATGLIHLHYSKSGGTSYLHASAWSTQAFGTKTIANGTTAATVSGGTITIPGTSATTGGLTSGVTYKWIAVGS